MHRIATRDLVIGHEAVILSAARSSQKGNSVTQVQYGVSENIAIVTLDNPPINALGHEMRRGIVEGIQKAIADSAVEAIVQIGRASCRERV